MLYLKSYNYYWKNLSLASALNNPTIVNIVKPTNQDILVRGVPGKCIGNNSFFKLIFYLTKDTWVWLFLDQHYTVKTDIIVYCYYQTLIIETLLPEIGISYNPSSRIYLNEKQNNFDKQVDI